MKPAVRTSTAFPNNLKPKIINVFVNGQNQHYKCEINPNLTKTWSEVLIQLGFNISPQFGSVKKLIVCRHTSLYLQKNRKKTLANAVKELLGEDSLSSLQPVRGIHELDSREKYIVLHEGEKFRRAPNGYKTSSEEEDTKKSGSSSLIKRKEVAADLRQRRMTKESQRVFTPREAAKKAKKEVTSGGTMKAGGINMSEKKQGTQESNKDRRVPCKHFNSTDQRVNANQQGQKDVGQKWLIKQSNVSNQSTSQLSKESTSYVNKEAAENEIHLSQPQLTELNKEDTKDVLLEGKVKQEYLHDAVNKIETNRRQNLVHTCLSPIQPPSSEKIHSTTSPMHKMIELKNRSVDKISIQQKTIETNYNHIEKSRKDMCESKANKLERQLQQLMELEKKKYLISMHAIEHVKSVLKDFERQSIAKEKIISKTCTKKNIFQPSPTESIKNIALLSQSSNTQKPKSGLLVVSPVDISTNKVPQAVRPIQKLVIPHEEMSSRMRDLKDTILAYRRDISEINQKIRFENEKCEIKEWMLDYVCEENQGELDTLKKPLVTSPSVETL